LAKRETDRLYFVTYRPIRRRAAVTSIHRNALPGRAVQKPLEVKPGKLIIRVFAAFGPKRAREEPLHIRFRQGNIRAIYCRLSL
jgi:hypothetical protein